MAIYTRRRHWKAWAGSTQQVNRLIRAALEQVSGDAQNAATLRVDATAPGIEDSFDVPDDFAHYLDLSDPAELRRILVTAESDAAGRLAVVLDFNIAKPAVHLTVRGRDLKQVERSVTLLVAQIEEGRRFAVPDRIVWPFLLLGVIAPFTVLAITDPEKDSGDPRALWAWPAMGAIAFVAVVGMLIPFLWRAVAPPLEITTLAGEPRVDRFRGSVGSFVRRAVGGTLFLILGILIQRYAL